MKRPFAKKSDVFRVLLWNVSQENFFRYPEEESQIFCWTLTQGCARFHVAGPGLFFFVLSGLRLVSFLHEQFSVRDAVGVADERAHRQCLRCAAR